MKKRTLHSIYKFSADSNSSGGKVYDIMIIGDNIVGNVPSSYDVEYMYGAKNGGKTTKSKCQGVSLASAQRKVEVMVTERLKRKYRLDKRVSGASVDALPNSEKPIEFFTSVSDDTPTTPVVTPAAKKPRIAKKVKVEQHGKCLQNIFDNSKFAKMFAGVE